MSDIQERIEQCRAALVELRVARAEEKRTRRATSHQLDLEDDLGMFIDVLEYFVLA